MYYDESLGVMTPQGYMDVSVPGKGFLNSKQNMREGVGREQGMVTGVQRMEEGTSVAHV